MNSKIIYCATGFVIGVAIMAALFNIPSPNLTSTVNRTLDFSICEEGTLSGAMGFEAGASIVSFGYATVEPHLYTCHTILYQATAVDVGGYDIKQCWVPQSVGKVALVEHEELLIPSVTEAFSTIAPYCETVAQKGMFEPYVPTEKD